MAATDTPVLIDFSKTAYGYRFRFRLRHKTLIVDTDHSGHPYDAHVEWPPQYGWPSPRVEKVARDLIRRFFLVRSRPEVVTYG